MKALDHKCPGCGAVLKFNPKGQNWVCEYCDSSFVLDELNKHKGKNDYVSKGEKPSDAYNCKNCGAVLVADSHTSATHCVYCGNVALIKEKLTGKFAPKKVLPFHITREDVINTFLKLQKGKILMPRLFNIKENIEKITGVYVPFWLYDVNVSGKVTLSGNRVTTSRTGDYLFTKTDIYNLYRNANLDYSNITLDASSRFDDDYMHSIEPFNYDDLKDYNHSYLSGFLAEIYDKSAEERYRDAESLVKTTSESIIKSKELGYSSVSIKDNNLIIKKNSESYCLLPVWMVNVKYNGKQYLFAVNGQTGKIIGNIPIDKKRLFVVSVLVFLITSLLTLLVAVII